MNFCNMNWEKARIIIKRKIKVGSDVNSPKSTYRKISAVNKSCYKYNYLGDLGFIVPIGVGVDIQIPFSMLKKCFEALKSNNGYDGKYFRKYFSQQASDHPCHVHTVGQIFVSAGLAELKNNKYYLIEDRDIVQ
jgi:hypothetical protein